MTVEAQRTEVSIGIGIIGAQILPIALITTNGE